MDTHSGRRGSPGLFRKLAPRAKVKLCARAGVDRSIPTRYLPIGADVDISGSVDASIPAVLSVVASYVRFCGLLGRPPFPPTTDAVGIRGATFNPSKTFSQYVAHLQKSAAILHISPAWPPIRFGASRNAFKIPTSAVSNPRTSLARRYFSTFWSF